MKKYNRASLTTMSPDRIMAVFLDIDNRMHRLQCNNKTGTGQWSDLQDYRSLVKSVMTDRDLIV